jgi:rhamnulokinase
MSKSTTAYLGFDLGAGSGRAVVGLLADGRLRMREIDRFANGPSLLSGRLYWDVLSLWNRMVESMRRCARLGYNRLAGVGVDTWGVDFGLLDSAGRLLGNPVCYRDRLTEGAERRIGSILPEKELYRLTGRGLSRVSTLSQLAAMNHGPGGGPLKCVRTLLLMPDLFRYLLCGRQGVERTAAGTSQLVDVGTGRWCSSIFKRLGLSRRMMPDLVNPGTVVGQMAPELADLTGLNRAPVVAVAGHDTASAAAAAPMAGEDGAFLSCGTWSVFGLTLDNPITTDEAFRRGFTNMLGFESILFARFASGLHLLESLRKSLTGGAQGTTHRELVQEASRAKPFGCMLDLNSPLFFAAENPRTSIEEFLRRTRQKAPRSTGAIIRAILEGLALGFRQTFQDLAKLTGRDLKRISLVGGGVKNRMLCQMTADATGAEVIAGPAEAAAAGNLAVQALAAGQLRTAAEVRQLVRRSFRLTTYRPEATPLWERPFARYLQILEKSRKLH